MESPIYKNFPETSKDLKAEQLRQSPAECTGDGNVFSSDQNRINESRALKSGGELNLCGIYSLCIQTILLNRTKGNKNGLGNDYSLIQDK